MVVFESLKDIRTAKAEDVGSKARALAEMAELGFRVPAALCISAAGYEAYMAGTGLRDRACTENNGGSDVYGESTFSCACWLQANGSEAAIFCGITGLTVFTPPA